MFDAVTGGKVTPIRAEERPGLLATAALIGIQFAIAGAFVAVGELTVPIPLAGLFAPAIGAYAFGHLASRRGVAMSENYVGIISSRAGISQALLVLPFGALLAATEWGFGPVGTVVIPLVLAPLQWLFVRLLTRAGLSYRPPVFGAAEPPAQAAKAQPVENPFEPPGA